MLNYNDKKFIQIEGRIETDETDYLNQLAQSISGELNEINFSIAFESLGHINSGTIEDIYNKYNHTNQLQVVREIFDKNYQAFNDYLRNFFTQLEIRKNNIAERINSGFSKLRDHLNFINENSQHVNNNNIDFNIISHIYDDDFVILINNLSTSIKEFFRNSRNCFTLIKGGSDSTADQILYSKSTISDILLQLNSYLLNNSVSNPKYSQKNTKDLNHFSKEIAIKEKINLLLEKIESINEIRSSIGKNIKTLEKNCLKFYDEAKVIFKNMKKTRNEKLDEIQSKITNNNINNFSTKNGKQFSAKNFNGHHHTLSITNLSKVNSRQPSNSPKNRSQVHPHTGPIGVSIDISSKSNVQLKSQGPVIKNENYDNVHQNNIYSKIPNSFETTNKEEKRINDQIDQYKQRNNDLLSELSEVKQKLVDMKFENLRLKEKIEKSNMYTRCSSNINKEYSYNERGIEKLKAISADQKSRTVDNGVIYNNKQNKSKIYRNISPKGRNIETVLAEKNENNVQSNLNNQKGNHIPYTNRIPNETKREANNYKNPKTNRNPINNISIDSPDKINSSIKLPSTNNQHGLAQMVFQFINQMTELQESISKKSPNVQQLKKNFELKKKEMCTEAEKIIKEKEAYNLKTTEAKGAIEYKHQSSNPANAQEILMPIEEKNLISMGSNSKPIDIEANTSSKKLEYSNGLMIDNVPIGNESDQPRSVKPTTHKKNISIESSITDFDNRDFIINNHSTILQDEVTNLNGILKQLRKELDLKIVETKEISKILEHEKINNEALLVEINEEKSKVNKLEDELREEKTKLKNQEKEIKNKINVDSDKSRIISDEKSFDNLPALELRLKEMENKNKENMEKLQRNEEQYQLSKSKLETSLINIKAERDHSTSLLESYKKDIENEINQKNIEIKLKSNDIKELEMKYKSTFEKLEAIEIDFKSATQTKEKLLSDNNFLQSETVKLNIEITDLTTKNEKIKEENKKYSASIEQLNEKLKIAETAIQNLKLDISSESLIKEDIAKELEQNKSKILDLNSQLKSMENIIEANEGKIKEVNSDNEFLSKELQNLQTEIINKGEECKHINDLNIELKQSEDNLKIGLDNCLNQKQQLENVLEELRKSHNDTLNTLSAERVTVEKLQKEAAELNKMIKLNEEEKVKLKMELNELLNKYEVQSKENHKLNDLIKAKELQFEEEKCTINSHVVNVSNELIELQKKYHNEVDMNKLLKQENEKNKKDLNNNASTNEIRLSEEKTKNMELSEMLIGKETEIEELKSKVANFEKEVKENKLELQMNIENFNILKKEKSSLDDLNQKNQHLISTITQQIKTYQEDIDKLNTELSKMKVDFSNKETESQAIIRKLNGDLNESINKNDLMAREYEKFKNLNSENNLLKEQLEKIKEEKDLVSEQLNSENKINANLKGENENLIQEKSFRMEEIKVLKDKIEKLNQLLATQSNDLNNQNQKIVNLEDNIKAIETEKLHLITSLKEIQNEIEKLKSLNESEMKQNQHSNIELNKVIKNLEEKINADEEKINNLMNIINDKDKIIKNFEEEINKLLENIKQLENDKLLQINNLKMTNSEVEKLKLEKSTIENKLEQISSENEKLTINLNEFQTQNGSIKLELENTTKLNVKFQEIIENLNLELNHQSELNKLLKEENELSKKDLHNTESTNQVRLSEEKLKNRQLTEKLLNMKEEKEKLILDLETNKRELESKIMKMENNISSLNSEISKLKISTQKEEINNNKLREELVNLKISTEQEISVYKNEFSLSNEKLANKDQTINELKDAINRKKETIVQIEIENSSSKLKNTQLGSELKSVRFECQELLERNNNLNNNILSLNKDINQLSQELTKKTDEFSNLSNENILDKIKIKELSDLLRENESIKDQNNKFHNDNQNEIEKWQIKFNEINNDLFNLMKDNKNFQEVNASLKNDLENINKHLNEVIERYNTLNEEKNIEFEKLKKKIDDYLIEKEFINNSLRQLLKKLNHNYEDKLEKYNEPINKEDIEIQKLIKEISKHIDILYNNFMTENKSETITYDPENFWIITDKQINNLKWVLISNKQFSENEITHNNTYWSSVEDNKIGKFDITMFNKYSSENDKNQEIKDLLSIQDELIKKLGRKEEEISLLKMQVDKLKNSNSSNINNNSNISSNLPKSKKESLDFKNLNSQTTIDQTIPLEKYQKLLNSLIEEQEKLRQSTAKMEKLKGENVSLRNIIEQSKTKLEKQGGNFSLIKDDNNESKFLDEIGEYFEGDMGEKLNLSTINIKEGPEVLPKSCDRINISKATPNLHNEKEVVLERKHSQQSIQTKKNNETQGSIKDSYRDAFHNLKESEKLLKDQLVNVKEELKETRNQRDIFKKKYDESLTLQDGKQTELFNMLKQAFEKLLTEIQITPKIKEYVNMILKILDYNDNDISKIINKKDNKGFFGMFGKK